MVTGSVDSSRFSEWLAVWLRVAGFVMFAIFLVTAVVTIVGIVGAIVGRVT